MVDRAVSQHLEVLRLVLRRGSGIRLVPCVGQADAFDRLLLDAVDRLRLRDACRLQDRRHDVDEVVELRADTARVVDMAGPGHDHALRRPAEMRRHLLYPLERCPHCPGPAGCEMRECPLRTPERIPEKLVLNRNFDTVECGELIRCAVEHALGARSVVAADVDDQGVVELSEVFHRLDDPPDLVVSIGKVGAVHIGLPDEQFLLLETERIPLR
ncbi:hypothetical protein D9M70_468630 [compost metagenome]